MPPKEKTIIPPEGDWKEHHSYLVEVAWKPSNPTHRAILFVGFLDKERGKPTRFGGYCEVYCNNYENPEPAAKAHYLKAVKLLTTEKDMPT